MWPYYRWRKTTEINEWRLEMFYQRQHALVHKTLNNNQIEMFFGVQDALKDGIGVASRADGHHLARHARKQFGSFVGRKSNWMMTVVMLKFRRM